MFICHDNQVGRLVFKPDAEETGWRSGFGMPQWAGLTQYHDYPVNRISFRLVANNRGDFMAPGLWTIQARPCISFLMFTLLYV